MREEMNTGEEEIQMQEGRQDVWGNPSSMTKLTSKYSKKRKNKRGIGVTKISRIQPAANCIKKKAQY
jgi:hypothetical protein